MTKNQKIGLAAMTVGMILMFLACIRIFIFWYEHDSYTGMQVIKAIPKAYIGLILNWVMVMMGRYIYFIK
jgi:hypothetical protein